MTVRRLDLSEAEITLFGEFIHLGVQKAGAPMVHKASHCLRRLEGAQPVVPPEDTGEVKPPRPPARKKKVPVAKAASKGGKNAAS